MRSTCIPLIVACLSLAGTAAGASGLDDVAGALRAMPVADGGDTRLPRPMIPLEARFKRLLRDEAEHLLPDADAAHVDLAALQRRLDALAARFAPADDGDEAYRRGPVYGNVLGVRAERPAGHPELLAIRTSVRVVCGSDESLALLERRAGRWIELLAVDSGAIGRIDGAFIDLDYRLGATRADGGFDVVAANVNPWCQSNWQTLRHAVYRVAPAHAARRLFAGNDSIFIGVDAPVYRIGMRPGGYTLSFAAEGREPGDVQGRDVEFRIAGDRVARGRTRLEAPR